VRACPKGAIASIQSKREKRTPKPQFDPVRTDVQQPYNVAEDYERFSEADMIFARVHNDPEFEYYHKNEWFGSENMVRKDLPGYNRFELELSVAGWKLYDWRKAVTGPPFKDANIEVREVVATERDPDELTSHTKSAARFFGASLVGIAEVDQRWLYSADRNNEAYDFPDSFNRVIVMAIEMDYDGISTSPAFPSSASTALGYSKMAFAEIELSAFIRRLGYGAIPCGNDIGLSVPMAIDAGLGQYGRHGMLITKEYGPRVRIAKVLTDMPLHIDVLDYGFCKAVIRFCEICEKCAQTCPSQSIPYGNEQTWDGPTRSNNPGTEKWFVDVESCYGFWVENGSDCSNCIRSCPYNKKDGLLHRMVLWVVRYIPWFNRLVVKMDDLFGYGKQKKPTSFWRKLRKP
jgi:reductive dehalogenase